MTSLERRFRTTALLFCGTLLAACRDGAAPKQSDVSLATLFADIREAETSCSAVAPCGGAEWPTATGLMPSPEACPYDPPLRRFTCTGVTSDGLTTRRHFQLLDASGSPQSVFSPATATIHAVTDRTGTTELTGNPPSSVSVVSQRERTLSGLRTETLTLNGRMTSRMEVTETSAGASTIVYAEVETWTDVVLPRRESLDRHPRSGAWARVTEGTEPSFHTAFSITFNGTPLVTMSVTREGQTRTCTVHLSSGAGKDGCDLQ